jgi:hypothetical protein
VFNSAFVCTCTYTCKHRFGVQLLQNPPLCSSIPEQLGQTVFLLSLALAFVPNAVIGLHLSLNGIDAAKVQGCHIQYLFTVGKILKNSKKLEQNVLYFTI